MAFAGEEVCERQLAHLRRRRLDQLLVAVAERRAPQPRHALDVTPALRVVDEDAFCPLQDQGAGFPKHGELRVGVNQGLDVANSKVAQWRHRISLRTGE